MLPSFCEEELPQPSANGAETSLAEKLPASMSRATRFSESTMKRVSGWLSDCTSISYASLPAARVGPEEVKTTGLEICTPSAETVLFTCQLKFPETASIHGENSIIELFPSPEFTSLNPSWSRLPLGSRHLKLDEPEARSSTMTPGHAGAEEML